MSVIADLWGAHEQSSAAEHATDAQTQAAAAAIAEQKRQFDITQGNLAPWLTSGKAALGQLDALDSGDTSSFRLSPDYLFTQQQGLQGLDRSAAARGGLNSGGHLTDLVKFGQGLAEQNYQTYRNGIAGKAGVGQTTAQNLGVFGQNYANQVGDQYNNIGQARASGYTTQGNAWANMVKGWDQQAGAATKMFGFGG